MFKRLRNWLKSEKGWSRPGAVLAAGAVTVIAGTAMVIPVTGGGGGGGPETANYWIDTSGGSCQRQSPAGPYIDGQACASPGAMYAVATAGDTGRIKGGDYGDWTFATKTISGPQIVIQVAAGENVTATSVDFDSAKYVTVRGTTPRGTSLTFRNNTRSGTTPFVDFTKSQDTYLENATIDGQWRVEDTTSWGGTSNRTGLIGVDACCVTDAKILASSVGSGLTANLNTVIRDSVIHGTRRTGQGVHNECWLASGHTGTTIERSHFYGCNVMNINFGAFGDASSVPTTGFVIRNSIFESPTDTTELPTDKTGGAWFNGCDPTDLHEGLPGAIIEYNIFETGWYIGQDINGNPTCDKSTGTVFRGNIGKAGGTCPTGATWSKNAWSDRTCGGTDQVISTLFTAGTNFTSINSHNWRPPSTSAAQCGQGDTSSFPATDLSGTTRVSPPDAGPYEC